jgi:hypothetical protein
MVTFYELADLLRGLGIDIHDLPAILAKKAGTKGLEKLAGVSKVVVSHVLQRIRNWRDHNRLEETLADSSSPAEREAATRASLERWIIERQHDATEATKLLFRVVYLRALRAHCNDLPVVASLGFIPQTLNDIWVQQHYRIGPAAGRVEIIKVEGRKQAPLSLEQAIADSGPRIIVEGPAGSGKSTQLRKFVLGRI